MPPIQRSDFLDLCDKSIDGIIMFGASPEQFVSRAVREVSACSDPASIFSESFRGDARARPCMSAHCIVFLAEDHENDVLPFTAAFRKVGMLPVRMTKQFSIFQPTRVTSPNGFGMESQ